MHPAPFQQILCDKLFFLECMRNFPNLYVTKGAGAFECWLPSSVSRFILYTWRRNLTLLKFYEYEYVIS